MHKRKTASNEAVSGIFRFEFKTPHTTSKEAALHQNDRNNVSCGYVHDLSSMNCF